MLDEKIKTGTDESGVVVMWNSKKGYGFIRPDAGELEDIFVHYTDICETETKNLFIGQKVYFRRESSDKGSKAVHVKYEKYRYRRYDE